MLRSGRIGAMRDVELYRALLGLTTPWTVASVDVDLKRAAGRRGPVPLSGVRDAGAAVRQQAPPLAAPGHDAVHNADRSPARAACCGSPGTRAGGSRRGRSSKGW